ncbi:DUF4747 family protein [Hyphobacterium sp.]|uniref:DUF4747 family protein n=1 Tax=Hyphobacterium sp. TaxID=2004662 RepID=UPI003BAACBB9
MARENTLILGALNVAAHPHPTGIYRDVFSRSADVEIDYWGQQKAKLTKPQDRGEGFFQGRILIWTEIDRTKPGIKKSSNTEVSYDELDVSIPRDVGFNLHAHVYTFRESDHTFFFEVKNERGDSLSPSRAKRILDRVFAKVLLESETQVDCTVVPRRGAVEHVLALPVIWELELQIVRPNNDVGEYQDLLDDLDGQGVSRQKLVYKAADRKTGIKPNDKTKGLAAVAAMNGKVTTKGKADGEKDQRSTEALPATFPTIVEEDQSFVERALSLARNIIL